MRSITSLGFALLSPKYHLNTNSVNIRIFRAALIVGSLTLGVKLVSMLKDSLIASKFGTGDAADAFLVAFVVPSYCINVVAGSFNAALVPTYIRVKDSQGSSAAQELLSSFVAISLLILFGLTIVLAIFSSYFLPLLGLGFGPEKQLLTYKLFYLLLPTICLNGLATIWMSVLNAEESFTGATLTTATIPFAQVVILLTLNHLIGIYALVWGNLAGFILQLCILAYWLRKQGFFLLPHWHGLDSNLRIVIKQYMPMIAGASLMSSTLLVDQAMAGTLGPGSVATLSYGNKLVSLILGIGTMALGTAVLPYFSKMVAASDWDGIRHSLKTYTLLILLISIPSTLFLILLSNPLISILYQRGNFTAKDVIVVSHVQIMYALQIPFYTLGILAVRLISSLRANHFLMWGTLISFLLNILLDYFLMKKIGVMGIALSTTLVYLISYIYLTGAAHSLLSAKGPKVLPATYSRISYLEEE